MSEFLENLKKSVDDGTFNSEAAKKINEIDDLADDMVKDKSMEEIGESIEEKIGEGEPVDEAKVAELNSQYEEKMKERAKEEILLAIVAGLITLDEELEEKLYGLGIYIKNLREEYMGIESNDALFEKLDQLEEKYDFGKYIAGE